MRIDIHSHVIPSAYVEAIKREPERMGSRFERDAKGKEWLAQENGRSTHLRRLFVDTELRLREMAEARIDVIVESLLPPLLPNWAPAPTAVRVCRTVNDAIAEDVSRYRGRIAGMGIVPLQDEKEALRELERLVKELGMSSVMITSNVEGRNLDEPEFFPFFERAQELGVLVFIHPHDVAAPERLKRYGLSNLIGNPLETTIAQASLIFGRVLERLPKLKICCAHAGGYSPWIIGRWRHGQTARDDAKAALPRPVDDYFRLLYFDTAIFDAAALQYLIRTVGSDHVLLGSDYPSPMSYDNQVAIINGLADLSALDKEKILGGNAASLLRTGD